MNQQASSGAAGSVCAEKDEGAYDSLQAVQAEGKLIVTIPGRPSNFDDIRKKLAKPPGSTVQSMAEALKPEHGLETLAILKSWAASAVCFSGGDGIRL
jgi:hypothetical protein